MSFPRSVKNTSSLFHRILHAMVELENEIELYPKNLLTQKQAYYLVKLERRKEN